MSIEGRIAIDVSFTDTATASFVQNVQRIALTSTDAYTTGKVAVISGTMTTAGTSISVSPIPGYVDVSGSAVSFTSVDRVAYKSDQDSRVSDVSNTARVRSVGGQIAIGGISAFQGDTLTIARTTALTWSAGTASYTLVLYGT